MATILIVEDDADKLRRVLEVINAVSSIGQRELLIARDAREAKRNLEEHHCDLMILDLALPLGPESSPDADGGVRLLQEIQDRNRYSVPREVVGLTAFSELREEAQNVFDRDIWSIVQFDPSSDAWAEQLRRKIHHVELSLSIPDIGGFKSHLCIICALVDPELNAVLRLPWQWTELPSIPDVSIYYEGKVLINGEPRTVYASSAPRMGMTAASVLATKMIERFRPRYLGMVGIAAGLHGRCEIGDVVAADPCWDWGSGKYTVTRKRSEFVPAPHQIALHSSVRTKLDRLARRSDFMDTIRRGWPGNKPGSVLRLLVGPMASGASVLADPRRMEMIERQNRKLLGIEMETYGVYGAASESRLPQPLAFSLKAICDFADEAKDDDFQSYAAYTSAATLRVFVEQFL